MCKGSTRLISTASMEQVARRFMYLICYICYRLSTILITIKLTSLG